MSKMHKDTFYKAIRYFEDGKIVALKVKGYSCDGIGLDKNERNETWSATHIDTGTVLVRDIRTRRVCLRFAKEYIAGMSDFADKIRLHKETSDHKAFAQSRYEQTVSYCHGRIV